MLNIKKVVAAVKKESKKGFIAWKLDGGAHYITNRHWAIKFNGSIAADVFTALLVAFNGRQVSEDGAGLVINGGRIEESSPDLKSIFDNGRNNHGRGQLSPFMVDLKDGDIGRIGAYDNGKIKVINKEYAEFLADSNAEFITNVKSSNDLLFFEGAGVEAIILPIRVPDIEERLASLGKQAVHA